MRALSIMQPWAWAILHAGKDIENRPWRTNVRGQIFIHAGKKLDLDGIDYLLDKDIDVPLCHDMGGIVGSVEIADCVEHSNSVWFSGKYGFVLKNPIVLPFIPCRGRLRFFSVDYKTQDVNREGAMGGVAHYPVDSPEIHGYTVRAPRPLRHCGQVC